MNRIEVVGLGALNVDHLYRVDRILDDGETVVEESMLSPGGSAANTIYGLAKLGISTGFSGVVGDDDGGKLLVRDFEKVGVDTSQIRIKPEVETGSVLCLSDRLGRRSLYVLPGANNLLTMDDLDLTYINQAKMLHLSSFADDRQFPLLLELMDKLELSVKLSFSPGTLYASKGLDTLNPILARTHVLFLNESEIQQLTGQDVIPGAESCLKQGCPTVAITLGKGKPLELRRGAEYEAVTAACYIREAGNEYVIAPASQNVPSEADTTGAGDAFATGFLYGLLKGKGLEECGHLGNIVAQFSTAKTGARVGLPTADQLAQRYRELAGNEL